MILKSTQKGKIHFEALKSNIWVALKKVCLREITDI